MSHIWLAVVAIALLAIFVPYIALNRESQTLDELSRANLGGSYVELAGGVTHYELSGPEEGPVALLIHGGTIPLFTWDAQLPALHEAGYRVLRYDQLGRGYSDRPRVDYDRAFYQRQLEDLMSALGIDGRVDVVGVSFGAAVAATFAAAHPERVRKLVLIAPVVDYAEGRALFGLAKVPLLSDWYARVFAVRGAVARANGFFAQAGADPSYAEQFDAQTRFEGFEQALLSMSRTDALASYRDTYAGLGEQPKLLIWGAEDAEIPRDHVDFIAKNVSDVSFVEMEGAGHGVTVEQADEVNRELVEFLTR